MKPKTGVKNALRSRVPYKEKDLAIYFQLYGHGRTIQKKRALQVCYSVSR
jgi:hypothetical protein